MCFWRQHCVKCGCRVPRSRFVLTCYQCDVDEIVSWQTAHDKQRVGRYLKERAGVI
jgi:hypothetical protein